MAVDRPCGTILSETVWGITERDGSRTTRVFDNRGRLKRERTPEGTDYTYGWDEHDRITGVSVRDARDPAIWVHQ